jgi:hypothetical protein
MNEIRNRKIKQKNQKKKEPTQLGWPIRPTKPTQRKVFFFIVP